jgi:ribosomal protein S12 methylthiotransferase
MGRRSLPVLPSGSSGPAGADLGQAIDRAVRAGAATGAATGGRGAPVRVAMVTLGCDKNTVDSERLLSQLAGAGAELAASPADADVVVVNTCGFIELAKQESIDTLLEAARLKESGQVRAVVGVGCLVQRYKSELEREMPEVDLFLGLTEADRLVPELARRGLMPEDGPLMERPLRVLAAGAGPAHSAHLKISEGCDHGCAFCAIPLMRGKFRSTPLDLLVREARELERRGVVELNVISQDTTWYGRDWARAMARAAPVRPPNSELPTSNSGARLELPDAAPAVTGVTGGSAGFFLGRPFAAMPNLGDVAESGGPVLSGLPPEMADRIGRTGALPLLLETLLAETSIPWIRLFYMYPSGITPELVELMAREDRIVPYLDMPIQHGSDAVLKRMRRPERRATILERADRLRSAVPGLALRTTVIVGFPGETEDDFESLLELLDEVGFDHLGAFAYSEEEDTPAASMDGVVPEPVRRERLERLLDHQRAISLERNEARIGLRTTVLVDDVADDATAIGRTAWQAAEVDGVVQIEGGAGLEAGRFVVVEITGADEYDLIARPI